MVRDPRPSEIVRHVALDILNDAIRSRKLDTQSLVFLRDNLMVYVRKVYGFNEGGNIVPDSINIQNKVTQTLTYLFCDLYATDWPSFFHDILSLSLGMGSTTRDNALGVVFYLRVLNSVHDEIADVLVPRTSEEQRRGNDLKDLVRQRDAKIIALSWQEILIRWKSTDAPIVAQCLAAVKRWVAWIDISLIVNDSFLNILFELITPQAGQADLTFVATETLVEIMSKKMSPVDKLELIGILKIEDVVSQLIKSRALQDLRSTPDYDTDLAESVAKLVNNTVYDIVKALDSVQDGTPASIRGIQLLNVFLPYVLRFFSDEYDEICSTVIPSMTDLLALFRKKAKSNSAFNSENAQMLPSILNAVILKMKYDETSSWGNEDAQTDEAEFQELRKRLQILQQTISVINDVLYIDTINNVVIGTFDKYQNEGGQLNWREVDLAMHEMFLFGDLGLKNGGLYSKTKPVSPAAERLIGMMFKLVDSGLYQHPAFHKNLLNSYQALLRIRIQQFSSNTWRYVCDTTLFSKQIHISLHVSLKSSFSLYTMIISRCSQDLGIFSIGS